MTIDDDADDTSWVTKNMLFSVDDTSYQGDPIS